MVKNLYLIRHGRQNCKLCNVNVELDEVGVRQAKLLANRLAKWHIDALYSSELLRAVETAKIVGQKSGLTNTVLKDIQEIDFGQLTGQTDEYIEENFSEFRAEWKRAEDDLSYPGGECGQEVSDRVMPVLYRLMENEDKDIVVVTHGGVIRSVLASVLSFPMSKQRLLGKLLENTGITQLRYVCEDKRFTVERFNDYAHLEHDPQLLRESWKSNY